ncbi:hypothetical protein [Caulobacter sp.]|uniref:hypothetical protein n=1 Tax=Caulobacter sp. TaxID=78 RepID=UPI001B238DF6|nr:hypothetical protein [Caulobacter sp.]MBO9543544.1 hypothetical protein [Caulobacter sp.]
MANVTVLKGTPGDDILIGGSGMDRLTGDAGNDKMYGFSDSDVLIGGTGDDLYDGGDGADVAVFEHALNGVRIDLAITGAQDTGEGRDTFISIEDLEGSFFADVFYGDDGENHLTGRAGNDILYGRGGDDFLEGYAGSDELHGGAGDDVLYGGSDEGTDLLYGDDGDDRIVIDGYNDEINDIIDGGAGLDTISFYNVTYGVKVDLAITASQDLGWSQFVTLKNVEKVIGTDYADKLYGDAGDNVFAGGAGDDFIDGRGGFDTVILSGLSKDYKIRWIGDGWRVNDQRYLPSADRLDVIRNIEQLQFADGEILKLVDGGPEGLADNMTEVFGRLLRVPSNWYSIGPELDRMIDTGYTTSAKALAQILKYTRDTTSVATLAYEFFTGKVPSQAGLDYLVSPTGPNPNNLDSKYYQSFNLENRYINFSVNLGKLGEGKDAFAAKYGSLNFVEATREAYKTIFGAAPSDAKIHAMIDTRVDYFAAYGGDGPNGIGTKAAMVGWLLAEAVKADVGVMVKSNEAWLMDLADGIVPFAIDILDPAKGYWKADFVFGGT